MRLLNKLSTYCLIIRFALMSEPACISADLHLTTACFLKLNPCYDLMLTCKGVANRHLCGCFLHLYVNTFILVSALDPPLGNESTSQFADAQVRMTHF